MVEFFPEKVYHCSCVSLDVKLCLVNGNYSLTDICNEINQTRGENYIVAGVVVIMNMLFSVV